MRKFSRLLAVAVLAAQIPLAMSGAGLSWAVEPEVALVDAGSLFSTHALTDDQVLAKEALESSLLDSSTGGVYPDAQGNLVEATTDVVPAGAVRQVRGVAVRRVHVPRSLSALQKIDFVAVQAALGSDADLVTGVGIIPLSNAVLVTFAATPSTKVRQVLHRFFGDAVVVTQLAAPGYLSGRYWSATPFRGGARIIMEPDKSSCSLGFQATYSGVNVMTTAGHCAIIDANHFDTSAKGGAVNEQGCTGICDTGNVAGSVWQIGNTMWSTQADANAHPSIDAALLSGGSYADDTWAAVSNTAYNKNVTFPGAATNYTGFGVCFSGATSQGSCGWVVDNRLNMSFCAVGGPNGSCAAWSTNPVWSAHSTGSQTIACQGDSGGIVYRSAPGGVSVLGSLSGAQIDNGVVCGTQTIWFTSWGDMTSRFPGFLPKIN